MRMTKKLMAELKKCSEHKDNDLTITGTDAKRIVLDIFELELEVSYRFEYFKRIGVKQLKKMIKHGSLKDTSAEALLRWWTGEWPASKVKGLTSALKEAGILPKE